ncbi:helix-turn-helix transcriptional regulator [Sphingomonas sp. CGMCC 1.13654]|uniref:Helix-turn-helix transcriptional regulator n=1 Tax=Sphingomonas chungangi TaxID=2683589 RepID=A0A838LBF3_9SPHN|nr:helix-turn-helix domain-containing protein [Sphingomonas chungangi]MBA2936571.1 helix-turn-helix transcriptional regulator [Sphingomonas chungangi]MVW55956.1 transcriptional regulator [Sphingomonas chungangi]
MDTGKFSAGPCPVARALVRVGDAWSMMILRDAGYGATRFDQFRTSLGIAPNILTRRLAALTEDGLLEKRRYSERPPRDEYVLTEKGRDFLPILAAIGAWGARHHGEGGTSRIVDVETGVPVETAVVDRATGRPLGAFKTRLVLPDQAG